MLRYKFLTAFLCSIAVCHADSVILYFTALPVTNFSPGPGFDASYNGYSTATIAGIPNQNLVCDDFTDSTTMPSGPWVYDYSTLGGSTPLQHAMYSGATLVTTGGAVTLTQTKAYDTAAVIMYNLQSYVAGTPTAQGITDYQYAIWNLFNPGTPPTGAPESGGSLQVQQDAYTAVLNNTTSAQAAESELVVYTPAPVPGPQNQEFLGLGTPAPEPASGALLAGLFGAAWIGARRRKKSA